ncbi:putative receptor-like protein kinase At3g47110 [Coffea arabica]|uniref:Receptor-like protein kinase At3g47110 n=1 Tax=Coffea arabica TaxID=13443 RepID=A0ABM4V3G5_COFAR
MSNNKLNGIIFTELFSLLSSLLYLNLSNNLFSGSLPGEISKMSNIYKFDISRNKFSGEVPDAIGQCSDLEYISMQDNFFHGTVPAKLASLKDIQILDMSRNNFTGQIPKDLEALLSVQFVNLSFNNLEGKVPIGGIFENESLISLVGNPGLCGGIPELQLPSCPDESRKRRKPLPIRFISFIVALGIIFVALVSFCMVYCRRRTRNSSMILIENFSMIMISYRELHKATEGFSHENLIGSGTFGSVYKGILNSQEQRSFAIKVFDLQKNGASKSFVAECRALRNMRHRNLVRVVTCCSSQDYQGREFKSLIYEFMSNGDLDTLNVAIDVASALNYLHNEAETPFVHCDLKPSNVLLDENLITCVGDFGLARLLQEKTSNTSSSIGIRGSIGYATPEYGMGSQVSTLGDVYSYGVLLLELLTGKRPTDDLFKDGFNLHDYVKIALPQLWKIVDPLLLRREAENYQSEIVQEEEGEDKMNQHLLALFTIGLSCSSQVPGERMEIKDVVVGLCFEHRLHGALIYLFNKGPDDFKTPLEELLVVLQQCEGENASALR